MDSNNGATGDNNGNNTYRSITQSLAAKIEFLKGQNSARFNDFNVPTSPAVVPSKPAIVTP